MNTPLIVEADFSLFSVFTVPNHGTGHPLRKLVPNLVVELGHTRRTKGHVTVVSGLYKFLASASFFLTHFLD